MIEIVSVITGVAYVLGALMEKKWCWPFGIISSIGFIIIAFASNYFQDAILNSYYVLAGVYGWYMWSKPKEATTIRIHKAISKTMWLYLVVGIVLSLLSGYLFQQLGNEKSYLDAFTTIFSFIATWMVARKEIENWLIWIVVDSVAAYMYFFKGYEFYAGLFVFYAIISIVGYIQWKKKLVHP